MENQFNQKIALFNQQYKERDSLYREIAANAGISEAAFWILFIVCGEENGTYSQSDICREWLYPKQTVNSAITKMNKQGLLELVPDKKAGNRKVLCLTDKGKKFCERWIMPVMKADYAAFSVMTEKEQNLYLNLTQKQLDCFREHIQELINQ